MLTLTPIPCPIEQRVEQIADTLFPPNWDTAGRATFCRLLLELAAEIERKVRG